MSKATVSNVVVISDLEKLQSLTNQYRDLVIKAQGAGTAFSLQAGRILAEVKDKGLYKAGNYKGIGDYAKAELDVSAATASTAIKVYEHFVRETTHRLFVNNEDVTERTPYKLLVALKDLTDEDAAIRVHEYFVNQKSVNAILDSIKKADPAVQEREQKKIAKEEKLKAEVKAENDEVEGLINQAKTEADTAKVITQEELDRPQVFLVSMESFTAAGQSRYVGELTRAMAAARIRKINLEVTITVQEGTPDIQNAIKSIWQLAFKVDKLNESKKEQK